MANSKNIQSHRCKYQVRFYSHVEEAELLSSTLVKHLEFRGNFEATVDKELAFSEYIDEGLLGKKTLQCQPYGRSIPRGTQKGQLNLDT